MTQPTIAQLRNLTDRAATGLTPDEQQRLRDGIDQLEALNTATYAAAAASYDAARTAEAAITRAHALADRWILPGYISMPEAANDLRNALKDQP